ncbi:unnamed protein product [Linum tenue]|nr:unnamed protein product [Linum tenue]
MISEPMR